MNVDTQLEDAANIDRDCMIEGDVAEVLPESQEAVQKPVNTEEFRVKGDELVAKIEELIHSGNIRRIIVKNESNHTLIEIPLTVGVVGGVLSAAFFPVLAALAAIGSVVAHLTLVIEIKSENKS
jgi:Domain of unknown function (DUF4342)